MIRPLADCRLYTFLDSAYLHGRNPSKICEQLCAGGSDIVQLRAKDWEPGKIEEVGYELLQITNRHRVNLVINDHPEIARRIGTNLCHLGQEDFFDAGYRNSSEFTGLKLGLSTHAPSQAQRAIAADPAYIAIGPIYPTGTKPNAKPVTLEYVRWAAENVRIPWFAIGGVNLATLPDVLAGGAKRICVVSAILNAPDVQMECRKFRKAIESFV
jgi:thiamine-phosphate pyrophosphorylase